MLTSRTIRPLLTLAALATALACATAPASAQGGFMDRLKKKAEEAAKRKAEERTEKRAGEAADAAMDKAECAAADKLCAERKAKEGANGKSGGVSSAPAKPGEGVWLNYDFVPGDRVIFADDFSGDAVGDFPRRLHLLAGNMEVVDWRGARYLRASDGGKIEIRLPETLPQRFTLEFDAWHYGSVSGEVRFDPKASAPRSRFVWYGLYKAGIVDDERELLGTPTIPRDSGAYRIRIMADGDHVKAYVNETRVANAPEAQLGRSKSIVITLPSSGDQPTLFGNIRVAAGGRALYDALSANGRVATQGILFDVGSDRIRPESTPTLSEIAKMLDEHRDLKLAIEGHTDDAGDAAANKTLSEERAAAVKAYLVARHHVEPSRLAAQGFGESKPAAPNSTAEGRQQNRRVELVKR